MKTVKKQIREVTEISVAGTEVDSAPANLYFSQLFEELGEAVLLTNSQGLIISANKAASRILRIPTHDLSKISLDNPPWMFVQTDGTPIPFTDSPASKVLRTGKPVSNIEIGVLRPDKSLVWILESAAPIFDEAGKLLGAIVTFPDISVAVEQRKELEELSKKYLKERDRANESNRLKSEFLANMSHEIRTPMTAILGFSDVLTTELAGKVEEHYHTFLRSINISGRRLLTLLNDILDLSKIEAGRVEVENSEVDVAAEIESYITPLVWIARQKSLQMNIELYPNQLIISCDRQRLGQAMTNIVSNAIKFTRKGSVTVRTFLRKNVGLPDQVAIDIQDTGIGIGKEFLPNLFEDFRQEHAGNLKEYGGTGLGLAISKRLINKMGGTIEVHSHKGKGSTFTILFPLVAIGRAPVVVKKEGEHEDVVFASEYKVNSDLSEIVSMEDNAKSYEFVGVQPQVIAKAHVLVVEDNIETQNLLHAYLRDGYRASFATDASEVFDTLERDPPDAILMDVNLPGQDGLSITRQIRAGSVHSSVPIIALTALAMSGDKQKCLSAGCNDYLSKPATRREVLSAITRAIETSSSSTDEF